MENQDILFFDESTLEQERDVFAQLDDKYTLAIGQAQAMEHMAFGAFMGLSLMASVLLAAYMLIWKHTGQTFLNMAGCVIIFELLFIPGSIFYILRRRHLCKTREKYERVKRREYGVRVGILKGIRKKGIHYIYEISIEKSAVQVPIEKWSAAYDNKSRHIHEGSELLLVSLGNGQYEIVKA